MAFERIGIRPAQILLPAPGVKPETWACIACDQYTSEPEYWQKAFAAGAEAGICRRRGRAFGHPADPAGI